MDIEATDFHSSIYRLVEEMAIVNDLSADVKTKIFRTLLLPRKFVDAPYVNVKLGDKKKLASQLSMSEKKVSFGLLIAKNL